MIATTKRSRKLCANIRVGHWTTNFQTLSGRPMKLVTFPMVAAQSLDNVAKSISTGSQV
jgi:hypothetical protein